MSYDRVAMLQEYLRLCAIAIVNGETFNGIDGGLRCEGEKGLPHLLIEASDALETMCRSVSHTPVLIGFDVNSVSTTVDLVERLECCGKREVFDRLCVAICDLVKDAEDESSTHVM